MFLKLLLIFTFLGASLAQNAPSINCNFTMISSNYGCFLSTTNTGGFDEFEGIQGTHMDDMTDNDVRVVFFQTGSSSIIPRILCNTFPNVIQMTFTGMGIETITNDPFVGCPNLEYLRLWLNSISEIGENTFANLPLQYIDLDNNRLQSLPLNVFQGLGSLTMIELQNNQFEDRLQGDIFRPLVNLRTLLLGNNGITYINRLWFETLGNLFSLSLFRNNITTLSLYQFIGLGSITSLDLSWNRISRIDQGAFNSKSELAFLYIYENELTEIVENAFVGAGLFYMDIDDNRITTIQGGAFRSLNRLVSLRMSNNNIKHLSSTSFEGLATLTQLNLNFNEIEDLPEGVFTHFENLQTLQLWGNELKVLHRHYFSNLALLTYVDLDDNFINGLERSIFEEATSLSTFWFWGNLCFSGSFFNFQNNSDNFMALLQRCFYNHRYIVDTTTQGFDGFAFFDFPNPGIQLRVNVPQEAHISLNPLRLISVPRIEIHIGAVNNTRSRILINNEEIVVDVSTPNILELDSWTGFRIAFANWMVLVFREAEALPFMAYNMQEFYPVLFYGIRSPDNIAVWSISPIG